MALDIGIGDAKTTKPYPAVSLSFDDDGYYWFCYPFFEELKGETGEMIDLYDGAWFEGTTLDSLGRTLEELAVAAAEMPDAWEVCIGHELGSAVALITPPRPIHRTVRRDVLLQLLAEFRALVRKAREGSKWIACLGD